MLGNTRLIKRQRLYISDPIARKTTDQRLKLLSRYKSLLITIERFRNILSDKGYYGESDDGPTKIQTNRSHQDEQYRGESDVTQESGPVSESVIVEHENIRDVGGDDPLAVDVNDSFGIEILREIPADLEDFLSRPIKIVAQQLTLNSDIDLTLGIWDLYFADPTVRAKLRNFGFIRANLCYRIAMSATPFHFGMIQASYVPYPAEIPAWQWYLTGPGGRFQKLVYLSQMSGTKVIDVKSNRPYDFKVPFISPLAMARLFNISETILADTDNFDDLSPMGDLEIHTLNQIKCASSGGSNPELFVYAWLEDVTLGCLTGTVLQITSESMYEGESDERKVGPVESVATKALKVADMLKKVPVIGPWAEASKMFLSPLKQIASLFGWSVPTMNTEPHRMRPEPFQNAANVIGYDTGHRLTLDPKQELTVDTAVVGTHQDEMALSFLTSVWSYLTTFTWSPSDTPLGSPIYKAMVHPQLSYPDTVSSSSDDYIQPTALGFAAQPFSTWRGKIKFMLQVPCSQMHRGKLAIGYEPNVSQNVLIDAVLDLNKQFLFIIDLAESQEVEFCIDWAFPRSYARCVSNAMISGLSSFENPTDYAAFANGYIFVTPLTTLQSPDNDSVSVNVFVTAEEMQFNEVDDLRLPTSHINHSDDFYIGESDAPATDPTSCFVLNPTGSGTTKINHLHYGEAPVSFRALIKRFEEYYSTANTTESKDGQFELRTDIDIFRDPRPSFSTDVDKPTLFDYLRYAYLAMRGGRKYRYVMSGVYGASSMSQVRVFLKSPSDTITIPSTTLLSFGAADSFQTFKGALQFIPATNGGIEFEIPFYTNNLFLWSAHADGQNTTITEQTFLRGFYIVSESGKNSGYQIHLLHAAAEDFSLMRFLAAPPYTMLKVGAKPKVTPREDAKENSQFPN